MKDAKKRAIRFSTRLFESGMIDLLLIMKEQKCHINLLSFFCRHAKNHNNLSKIKLTT